MARTGDQRLKMSALALVVIGVVQAAFILGLLTLLVVTHRKGRRENKTEDAAVDTLRGPIRALMLGQDTGESLAAELERLEREVATRHVLAIAAQLAPEPLRHLAMRVRSQAWVNETLAGGTSNRWWKRMEAARLLAVVCTPEDRPMLARLVCDPNPAVASAATAAIARHVDAAMIESIIVGLSQQPPSVRLQQMRALRLHGDIATPILVEHLESSAPPPVAHVRAFVQLAEVLGSAGALAAVVPLASHEDAELRATVARALRSCFMPTGVAAARRLLKDTDWRVRAAAARALAGLNDIDSIPDLHAAMRDESWWVRFRAALALGALGALGEAALLAAAGSDDAYARDMAVVVRDLSESSRLELSA